MSRTPDQHNEPDTRSVILAIELSNPTASPDAHCVALFKEASSKETSPTDELIGSVPIPEGLRSADALMVMIDTLCTKHQITPSMIGRLMVSIGPGGYTALRISSTTAKVLAQTLGCELVAVPSARVAAAAIEPKHRPALIALASKNEHAHCSIVHADGSVESVGVIDAQALDTFEARSIVGDAHLPRSFIDAAKRLGWSAVPIVLDARHMLEAGASIEPIEPIGLSPIYAREPDAITQWRARHGSK